MTNYLDKPLFVFEMANNHMGDINHGIHIVEKFGEIIKHFPEFNFAMKLQYRDDSFFHPEHIERKDHKLIKRFTETRLGDVNFTRLIDSIHNNGFISMCTPWDEKAVEYQSLKKIQIIKVASCSFTDWHLLEKISEADNFIILSTAGASELDLDNVFLFFRNRNKSFAFLHCVGEYPCIKEHLDLNQIDFLHHKFDIPIGYSTHEDPNNFDSIKIAIAKGALIFEKHVGIETDKYELNKYSASPEQIKSWLESARDAYLMCGHHLEDRKNFSDKEIADLRILYRGLYAKYNIKAGSVLSKEDVFLAMPNEPNQLVAKEFGKYNIYETKVDIQKNQPIYHNDLVSSNSKDYISSIFQDIKELIESSYLRVPLNSEIEISHHYGIENFSKFGAAMIHVINRVYSKIIMIMLPNQHYPKHKHIQKDETYFILYGNLVVWVEGVGETVLTPGETYSVKQNTLHSFSTKTGVVFEEIATAYIKGDSVYDDNSINLNKKRKTTVTYS